MVTGRLSRGPMPSRQWYSSAKQPPGQRTSGTFIALNALSTVFTMDIFVKKFQPNASQKKIVKVGHLVTVSGAILSIFITMAIDSIKGLNLFDVFQSVLGFIAPPMSVVFLFGVLWKKTTTKAANSILIFE